MPGPNLLNDRFVRVLVAGDLEAVFLPNAGMLGASLRHKGVEILGRVADLDASAAKGTTAGIPLLHPWANRLAGTRYRAAGHEVVLDSSSPLLHLDALGLPIHGVPWPLLGCEVIEAGRDRLSARLQWTRSDLLAVFPFPHSLDLTATLALDGLTLETTLTAGPDGPVPVSFGYHPYFQFPETPRAQWRLQMPAMRRFVLDPSRIPTGAKEPFAAFDAPLSELEFDDGFELLEEHAAFALAGAERQIVVELLRGYTHAQVFAPKDRAFVALEPMTAPSNALVSGRGLRLVAPRGEFQAAFRIRVEPAQ